MLSRVRSSEIRGRSIEVRRLGRGFNYVHRNDNMLIDTKDSVHIIASGKAMTGIS